MERKVVLFAPDQGMDRQYDSHPTAEVSRTARKLVNWEPEPDGSIRARRQWMPGATTGQPATRKVRAIGYYPVHAGFVTPVRRQWQRRMARDAGGLDSIEVQWDRDTMDGSFLLAFLTFGSDVSIATTTVSAPAGWTQITTDGFPIRTSNNLLEGRVYRIEDAAARNADGTEEFTFGTVLPKRAQLYVMEWRGVKRASPVDVKKCDTGFGANPNTGLIGSATTQEKEVAVGFLAALPTDESFELEQPTQEWYDFRVPSDDYDVGGNEFFLDMRVYRRILNQTTNTLRLEAIYSPDKARDAVEAYWVAGLVTLKAHDRGANDKDFYFVANKDSDTTYRYYQIDEDDFHTGGSWTEVTPLTVAGRTVTLVDDSTKRLALAAGNGVLCLTHPDISRVWAWNNDILVPINRSRPGECIAFYNNQFYTGGGKDDPNRLYWSDIGDHTTWDEDSFLPIGDGTPLLDICPVRDGLLIAKFRELYFFSWQGGPSLQKLDTGGGCRGRCILPIPGGALIAGRRHIWYWGGGSPELISHPLNDWWAQAYDTDLRPVVSGAYMNGRAVFSGAMENSNVQYDTVRNAWWIEDMEQHGLFFTIDDRNILFGPWDTNDADWPLLSKQQHPWGDRKRDDNGAVHYEFLTQEMMLGTPSRPVTPRWLFLAWRQRFTTPGEKGIKVTPIYDGVEQTERWVTPKLEDGSYRVRLDVGVHARSACHKVQFRIEHDTRRDTVQWTTTYDLEMAEFVYEQSEPR